MYNYAIKLSKPIMVSELPNDRKKVNSYIDNDLSHFISLHLMLGIGFFKEILAHVSNWLK